MTASERIRAARQEEYVKFATMLASHGDYLTDDDTPIEWSEGYEAARLDIGRSLAAILRLDNPNFDANRFYEAAKL
jgi:hypothetical protein